MIAIYQHIFPVNDYRERAHQQQARIRDALGDEPYRLVSVQAERENITLRHLWQDACHVGADFYCYVHLKGITKGKSEPCRPFVMDWAELLEYFIIDLWHDARQRLIDGADVAGCNYGQKPGPHFSGNFFWLKQSVAALLETPDRPINPESWLFSGSSELIACELHHSGINPYYEPYPREMYR